MATRVGLLRGAGPTAACSLDLGQCAMSLAVSPDRTRALVAGRDVLKIVSFNGEAFALEEERNLRVGKHGLTLCSVDGAWHPLEAAHSELATAASNGHVVWWDLSVPSENKLKHIIKAHTRTANCVVFHPVEAAILLSGSQDETVRKWDTRALAAPAAEFATKETVRSVRINPHQPTQFVVALESGNLQLWDARMPGACEHKIQAHQGPAYTVAWHPTRRHVLASAGRDKVIRVWDAGSREPLRASVQTIASVARVLWRPGHPDHIASCSLVHDRQIHVWDIRQDFLPVLSLEGHANVPTDLAWDADGAHVLLSVGKDNHLLRHTLEFAARPRADALAEPAALALAATDALAAIVYGKGPSPLAAFQPQAAAPAVLPPPWAAALPPPPSSPASLNPPAKAADARVVSLLPGSALLPPPPHAVVTRLAAGYAVACSAALPEPAAVAAHNAVAADAAGERHIAHTWRIVRELWLAQAQVTAEAAAEAAAAAAVAAAARARAAADASAVCVGDSLFRAPVDLLGDGDVPFPLEPASAATAAAALRAQAVEPLEALSSDSDTGSMLDELSAFEFVRDGDGDGGGGDGDGGGGGGHATTTAARGSQTVSLAAVAAAAAMAAHSGGGGGGGTGSKLRSLAGSALAAAGLAAPRLPPAWDCTAAVAAIARAHAAAGDPQTPALLLAVFGPALLGGTTAAEQHAWTLDYADVLARLRLFVPRAALLRACPLPEVAALTLESTTVHTCCGACGRAVAPGGSGAWRCQGGKCREVAGACHVCHEPVRGLHVWCQVCGHGGHIAHVRAWLAAHRECPAGCGHHCELG